MTTVSIPEDPEQLMNNRWSIIRPPLELIKTKYAQEDPNFTCRICGRTILGALYMADDLLFRFLPQCSSVYNSSFFLFCPPTHVFRSFLLFPLAIYLINHNPSLAYSLLDQISTCPSVREFLLVSASEYIGLALDYGADLAQTVGGRWPHYLAFRTLKEAAIGSLDSDQGESLKNSESAAARLDEIAVQSSLLAQVLKIRREISSRKFSQDISDRPIDLRFREKTFSQYEGDGVLEGILDLLGLWPRIFRGVRDAIWRGMQLQEFSSTVTKTQSFFATRRTPTATRLRL